MNCGSGWVLIEQSYHHKSRKLLSILSARKTSRDVSDFMEQLYVDRFSSIHEKIFYKKSRKTATYPVMPDRFGGVLHCGHDPFFVCVRANKITLKDNLLEFTYRIVVNADDPLNLKFENRTQTLVVDV